MKSIRIFRTAVFGVGILFLLISAIGSPDGIAVEQIKGEIPDSIMQQDTIVITGRILVSGHEPFTVLAIEREDGSSVVLGAPDSLYKELWSYQNEILRCQGKFKPDPLHGEMFYVMEFRKHK